MSNMLVERQINCHLLRTDAAHKFSAACLANGKCDHRLGSQIQSNQEAKSVSKLQGPILFCTQKKVKHNTQ